MKTTRRSFLKTTTGLGLTTAVLGSAVLVPQRVLAAYPQAGFDAKDVPGAVKGCMGTDQHTASADIKLKAPDIAENGAVVPITVSSSMSGVTQVAIVAAANPSPLTTSFDLTDASEPYVSTRIKLGKTGDVIAVMKSDGKLYSAKKEVKVTIGGCGG